MSLDASSPNLSDDLSDYDVVSSAGLDSSLADLGAFAHTAISEPSPSEAAKNKFGTVNLTEEEIQEFVRKRLGLNNSPSRRVRVYVDGVYDPFNSGHALQLRQAKLSFPSVHLMVGVFSDELCEQNDTACSIPHVERCELIRHCRWVDEVITDAPFQISEDFVRERRIEYVAVEDGITVDPKCHKVRLRGYDDMKRLGNIIPTRRTLGLQVNAFNSARSGSTTPLTQSPRPSPQEFEPPNVPVLASPPIPSPSQYRELVDLVY